MSWNQASAAVVKGIFSHKSNQKTLQSVRAHFDAMINYFWLQDRGESTADWVELGAAALAAGRAAGVFQKEDFSDEVAAVLVRKQTDYGHDNIARFGLNGLIVRMHDKIARLENLAARGVSPENESIRDNYLDVLGYATIGVMWSEGTFLMPLDVVTVAESN
jgi:hypothetical protein